ncbi:MAG: methyltransferase domain-containing protein [Desulfuromusa sp.]|jgi:3' terminal RNA ribose 2'-O-methyltransferase Hen1|nr:methyltransferase domain-containing protein [Desulfuromusa sp.]
MRCSDDEYWNVTSLHQQRLEKVVQTLLTCAAEHILDLGCGQGELLTRLACEKQFKRIVGMDTSIEALTAARQRLTVGKGGYDADRFSLCHASFTDFDKDFAKFDAAVMVETIEHIEPKRLSAVERAVFIGYRPKVVLITTPNYEYNTLHGLPEGALRHRDHYFEWSRTKFRAWAGGVAKRNNYLVVFDDIGTVDPRYGSSTQMATFKRG